MVKLTIKDIILDTLIFLGIIITFAWLILKQLGFIHSPWFIEIIPFVASGIAISAFIYHAIVFIHELMPLPHQMQLISKRADAMERRIDGKFEQVDRDFDFLKKAITR